MTLEKAIITALERVERIKGKVYPMEVLKNATVPFAFYRQTAGDEEDDLAGSTELNSATFEIHCVDGTYAGLVNLAGSVRAALKSLQGGEYEGLLIERVKVRQTSPDLHEREVNMMRRVYTIQIDYQKEDEK